MKGSYVLVIHLPVDKSIETDSLRTIHFTAGYYAYFGSAMRGFSLEKMQDEIAQLCELPRWGLNR